MTAPRLSQLTTTAVGGPVTRYVEAGAEEDLVAAVSRADRAGERVLVVGGGSNILASDEPFEGTVVLVGTRGFTVSNPSRAADHTGAGDDAARGPGAGSPDGGAHHGSDWHLHPADGGTATATETGGDAWDERSVLVEAAAGHPWDDLVRETVELGLAGLETLSGIPGTTGATPVQNVGEGLRTAIELGLDPVWHTEDPDSVATIRNSLSMSATPTTYRKEPPALGEDGDAIRAWLASE